MMKKPSLIVIMLAGSLWLSCLCFAEPPLPSTELIENAKKYDGRNVLFQGEVIGDIMIRGQNAWLNINDGQNAIGVWMPKSLTEGIDYSGSYTSKGDLVEVSGTFHRACALHGADLDIHAQALRKIKSGRPAIEKINSQKERLVVILAAIMGLVWILTLLIAR